MKILAIETSCDETAAAVTEGRRVLSNVVYSQVVIHNKWGGVVPSLAKRAHQERIDMVIEGALQKYFTFAHGQSRGAPRKHSYDQFAKDKIFPHIKDIDAIAVTYGPGLAIALEVGIAKAKELAIKYNKKLVAVDHMEGHIYSAFAQNSQGNPKNEFHFPYLSFLISGGHTELVLFKNHIDYEILGSTIDDAAGEALDKAAKMLGLGYPGGPVIERLAQEVSNIDLYKFPRPMIRVKDLQFSFSGLKTAFLYYLRTLSEAEKNKKLKELASAFQEAVMDTLCIRLERAIIQTGINRITVGGGVSANQYLRKRFRAIVAKHNGSIVFPSYKYLTGDNAAMIGVAAYYKAQKKMFVKDLDTLDRVPRLKLGLS